MLSARDIREFRGFLRQATDRQVQGIYDKEQRAGRDDYAELAVAEAERRSIVLDAHATKKRRRPDRPLTKEEVSALQARGREAAADGRMGMELDNQLKAERLSPAEHRIVRAAFNIAVVAGDDDDTPRSHSTKKSPEQLDREISKALAPASSVGGTRSLLDVIRAGHRVTIVDRFGKQRTGKAVMRGPYGWVLNLGGKHGTPGIATNDNIVSVRG